MSMRRLHNLTMWFVAVVAMLAAPALALAEDEHSTADGAATAATHAADDDHATQAPGAQAGDGHGSNSGHDDHGGHDEELKSPVETLPPDLVIYTMITFGVFMVVLKFVAWKPLIAGLDAREAGMRRLLADAEADRAKATRLLAEYEQQVRSAKAEVEEIIAEARRDADRTRTDIISAATTEAEAIRKRALDEIGRARDQAVAALFDHMRAGVVAATEKVLVRSLNDADHQRLIDEALREVAG